MSGCQKGERVPESTSLGGFGTYPYADVGISAPTIRSRSVGGALFGCHFCACHQHTL